MVWTILFPMRAMTSSGKFRVMLHMVLLASLIQISSASESTTVVPVSLKKTIETKLEISFDVVAKALIDELDLVSRKNLIKFNKDTRRYGFIDSSNEELAQALEDCEKLQISEKKCSHDTNQLKRRVRLFKKLNTSFENNPNLINDDNLLLAVLVFQKDANHLIGLEFQQWQKKCENREKINTNDCSESLKQILDLYQATSDLAALSFSKFEKIPSGELIKKIRERISPDAK